MAQRKIVMNFASSIETAKAAKKIVARRSVMARKNLVPVAPAEDLIPIDIQREKKLGPDFNPDYFSSIDALIEESYGPITGEFRVISG